MAIAIRDSVTVSMAEESSGVLTVMRLEIRDDVSASEGITSVWPGSRSTSSYVRPMNPKGSWVSFWPDCWVTAVPLSVSTGGVEVGADGREWAGGP